MIRFIASTLFLTFASSLVCGQRSLTAASELTQIELMSPWEWKDSKTVPNAVLHAKSCFDLLALERRCGGAEAISYGNRFGDNWDILSLELGKDSQSRMVDLGNKAWSDTFDVPWIRPWAKLREGEQRHITVNTSGGNAGAPGYGARPVAEQVSSKVKTEADSERPDNYTPFLEAKKGHMYAVRVVNAANDFYLLFHVDDIERGTMATISFKKVDGPTQKPVF